MTDKEIKKMIKNAYVLPTTESETRFVKRNEKRSLQIVDVLKVEFEFMGLQSILAGFALCLLCLLVVKMENLETMCFFSSMIPFGAMIPMILLSKSERCGMDEMEAACRFSLRFVRLVRMCIIGVFTLALFIGIGIILRTRFAITGIDYLACVITPYLVSDFGAMLVTRRWHSKDNIYGIFAACITSSLIPFVVKHFMQSGFLSDVAIVVITVTLLIAIIRESIKYVKESENISWNLC